MSAAMHSLDTDPLVSESDDGEASFYGAGPRSRRWAYRGAGVSVGAVVALIVYLKTGWKAPDPAKSDQSHLINLEGLDYMPMKGFGCKDDPNDPFDYVSIAKTVPADASSWCPGAWYPVWDQNKTVDDIPTKFGLDAQHVVKVSPAEVMEAHCPHPIRKTLHLTVDKYTDITSEIKAILNGLPEICGDDDCPRADWAGCVLRMAGHDFMDYVQPGEGGSDGCTDFEDPDNAGLKECLSEGEHGKSVGDVYKNYCDVVSLADMIVIAAEAVMEETRRWHIEANKDSDTKYKESKPISFINSFKFGRETRGKGNCTFRPKLLPNPEHGCHDVSRNFIGLMGLTPRQTACISGVHTLGRASVNNSGFSGWWSDPLNSRRFNNDYFLSMISKGWMPQTVEKSGKQQWMQSDRTKHSTNHQMMLTSDLCLAYGSGRRLPTWYDGEHEPYTPLEHWDVCCAWVEARVRYFGNPLQTPYQTRGGYRYQSEKLHCGEPPQGLGTQTRKACCHGFKRPDVQDCGNPQDPRGIATDDVIDYAADDNLFVTEFKDVWVLTTEMGHKGLQHLEGLDEYFKLVGESPYEPPPTKLDPEAGLEPKEIAKVTPAEVMEAHCPQQIPKTLDLTKEQYTSISKDVKQILNDLPEVCQTETCPRADWAGCVLRMAGHDFMDYVQPGEGGSDGCTDFEDPDNAGLKECLSEGEHGKSVGDVYKNYCDVVSLADMIVIAAEAVIEETRRWHIEANKDSNTSFYNISEPISFLDTFRFGRATKGQGECEFRPHLLPNPSHACDDVKRVFLDTMGFSLRETACISGVHTLGRASPEFSGFSGWWSDPLNSRRFNNNYYVSMVSKGWTAETVPRTGKFQWRNSNRVKHADNQQMMLTSDLCLFFSIAADPNQPKNIAPYKPLVEAECCAWAEERVNEWYQLNAEGKYNQGLHCGSPRTNKQGIQPRKECCEGRKEEAIDCGNPRDVQGMAFKSVLAYANDDNLFVRDFKNVWVKATEMGHTDLQPLKSTS